MKILKYITVKDFTYIGIIIIIIFMFLDGCNNKDYNLNTGYQDTMQLYKNKYGEQVARNQVMVLRNFKQLNQLKSKDKDILELQSLITKYKSDLKRTSSLVVIKSDTKIDTVYKTQVLTRDSIGNPTYGFEDNNKWYQLKGRISYDSTKIEIAIHNEYLVLLKSKRKGLFGSTPVVEVINQNPYSSITDLKSIKIDNQIKNKRGGIGLSIGYGISYDFKSKPFIGVSYNYNLIRFP